MNPEQQIQPSELTEASARPTKAQPANTAALNVQTWQKWLGLDLCGDPQLEQLALLCGQFATLFHTKQNPSWISLLGKCGTAKTHCASRLWRYMSSQFKWDSFEFLHGKIYWPELIENLRGGRDYELLQELRRWPVLFLDDVGAERDTTGFAAERLNTLLGCRVGKWTILTSNLTLEHFGSIDPRIADRIVRETGNLFIELTTTSYGLRKFDL